MAVFLTLNGHVLEADVDEQERVMLALASSVIPRDQLVAWVEAHAHPGGGLP
jgi:prophage maintenance system killer protein